MPLEGSWYMLTMPYSLTSRRGLNSSPVAAGVHIVEGSAVMSLPNSLIVTENVDPTVLAGSGAVSLR